MLQPPWNLQIKQIHDVHNSVWFSKWFNFLKDTNTLLFSYLLTMFCFVYFVGNSNCPWNVTHDHFCSARKKKIESYLLAIPYLSLIHILAKISVRICFCICKARMYTNQMNDRILDFSNFLQYLRFKLRTSFFPLYLLNHTECVSIEMSCYDVQCKNCNIATSFHLSSSSCNWISKAPDFERKILQENSLDFSDITVKVQSNNVMPFKIFL